jgi:tetratricopeptide (TPR) repeat protein
VEVNWRDRHWQGYAREARAALARALAGEQDLAFDKRVLELIRTYVESPRSEAVPADVDEAIVRLAICLHYRLHHTGHWRQLAYLWPHLVSLARDMPDVTLLAQLTKQQAITVGSFGTGQAAQRLYHQLVQDVAFARLPIRMQVDILVNVGTSTLWAGELRRAEPLLHQALMRVQAWEVGAQNGFCTPSTPDTGPFAQRFAAQLWESKVYALNQLGCLALFRGQFDEAERYYRRCLALFLQQGEAEGLACVAYQALGRLLLYQGQISEAIPLIERGLAIRRRRLEQEGIATNLVYWGAAHLAAGDLNCADTALQEALALAQHLQSATVQILAHLYFGQLALCSGNPAAAASHWQQALVLLRSTDLPLVEQRVWLIKLPWLWRHQLDLACRVTGQLARSAWRQRLGPLDLWRLVRQVRRGLLVGA